VVAADLVVPAAVEAASADLAVEALAAAEPIPIGNIRANWRIGVNERDPVRSLTA